uniref:Uncharacterized protein n=1 Tax=Lactuca sativa TaxID=4236 RepID=A0A9R1UHR8_LACSA|nr:hypothetical protein LSAT_V11C900480980 [Lactuca sativa]
MVSLNNRPIYGVLFRQSFFGDYVNMRMGIKCHPLLCHYLMCKEFTTFDHIDLQELLFPFGRHSSWSPSCSLGIISTPVLILESSDNVCSHLCHLRVR